MISYLSGFIQAKVENFLIINTGGVGYQVFTTTDLFAQTREKVEIDLFIYTVVREQEISLYGFLNIQERQFFELLISVSGIGPKSALEFLNIPLETIKEAISSGDSAFLTKVKGVGKKTAERIIVELKGKMGVLADLSKLIQTGNSNDDDSDASMDVIMALEGLGFDRIQIVRRLKTAPEFESVESAVLWFLQNN